ncbi:MAG: serine/threonine protein kinase [Planctomycetaceae bacterium]|jgi:serine/threonine-protein kinase|nr:serine/threonine protein kinase [Planctomycetaceae bacterium]
MSSDILNRQFGDYQILRNLGGGAMADVYLAEQRSLARRVALKILKTEFANDELYVRRFSQEAQAIARIVHPNIVHVYEVGKLDGLPYIAQEYVPGDNLLKRIERSSRMTVTQVVEILWMIGSALEKTSAAGIVHRDIKPENILIADTGEIKVADFGLAREIQSDSRNSPSLTQAGMTVGTPLYMSPEQAQGRTLDHRSDMYSLGITCYHALAGHPPFNGETSLAVVLAHVNTPPEPLERVRKDIPPILARIIHRMIAKLPEQRFQSFNDLLQELRLLQAQHADILPSSSNWSSYPLSSEQRGIVTSVKRLDNVMKTERRIRRRRYIKYAMLLLIPFLISASLTYVRIKTFPRLLEKPAAATVPQQRTVAEQWLYASRLNTIDAWQSVVDYPHPTSYWSLKAKRQQLRLAFQDGMFLEIQNICQEFVNMNDTWPEYQALGHAGLAWCYAKAGETTDASSALQECVMIKQEKTDPLTIQVVLLTSELLREMNK